MPVAYVSPTMSAESALEPLCQPGFSRVESQDKFSGSLSNDDIKHWMLNNYAKFVSDVDPDRLCDWLVQASVISTEKSKEIRSENRTPQKKCRALLDLLFSTQHPRAFLVVRQALSDENHYLLEFIDRPNQESGCGIRERPDGGKVSLDSRESWVIEEKHEQERKSWSEEREQLTKEIQEYKQDRKAWSEEREQLTKQIHEYKQDRKAWSEEREQLKREIQEQKRLNCRVSAELRCKSDPVLIKTIRTKSAKEKQKAIRGLTILDSEMFIVSWESSGVEVYDSVTFSFSRQWNLKELLHPVDLSSCNRNKCLYIFDHKGSDQSKEILRTDPNGNLLKNWSTGDDYGHGLSVTDETNVLLTVYNKNKLNEYSPDGQLIREIKLSSDAGICHPRHARKLSNGHYVVSHGYDSDDLHRVCIVDAGGKLQKSFGGKPGSTMGQMNYPIYLAVDGNGFVMVADRGNQRVLLLDQDLTFKREILSKETQGLKRVWSILLEESNGRLYITDNEFDSTKKIFRDGRIVIFDFK